MKRTALAGTALAIAAAVLAACDGNPVVTVTAPAPTSTASASASPIPVPTPTPTPTATGSVDYLGFDDGMWNIPASTDGAAYSGCSPGPGALPTGIYLGYTSQWNTQEVHFDLVCFWTGDEAEEQMIADGIEPDPYLEDEWYITNDNSTIRVVPVGLGGNIEAKKCDSDQIYTLPQVIADPGGTVIMGAPYLIRIYVTDGEITALACHYLP